MMLKALLLLCSFICISLHAKEVLHYATHSKDPPMSWEVDGGLAGVSPDLIELIFDELGVPYERVNYPWARALHLAEQGAVDLMVNLYFNEQRARYLTYLKPHYYEATAVVVFKRGNAFEVKTWQDLMGRRGGAIIGESWGEPLDRFIQQKVRINRVAGYEQNLKMLVKGRLDFTLDVGQNIAYQSVLLGLEDKLIWVPLPDTSEKMYFAFSKQSPFIHLLPKIEQRLTALKAQGVVESLLQKHMLSAHTQ